MAPRRKLFGVIALFVLLAALTAGCAALPLDLSAIKAPASANGLAALLPTLTPEAGATPPLIATGEPRETAVRPIPLAGPAAQRNAEFSALAWYGETLTMVLYSTDSVLQSTMAVQ